MFLSPGLAGISQAGGPSGSLLRLLPEKKKIKVLFFFFPAHALPDAHTGDCRSPREFEEALTK